VNLPPFQLVVDELGPSLRRHVAALVGTTDADDVVQDTLIAALRAYTDLPDGSNVRAWLWTIARNKAIDRHRAQGRRPRTTPLLDANAPAAVGADDVPAGDDGLWAAVRRLPEAQRLAVSLRFADDLSYAQIAELCGCSAGAARQRVYEGLQALRQGVNR
jgi:RNA polymerase sigma factor (sigma-70 family)